VCDAPLYSQAHALANTTDALLAIGGAMAITSLVLILVRPRHRAPTPVHAARSGPGLAVAF
jgi:hypothetical protein